jgi:hypothetical protein
MNYRCLIITILILCMTVTVFMSADEISALGKCAREEPGLLPGESPTPQPPQTQPTPTQSPEFTRRPVE